MSVFQMMEKSYNASWEFIGTVMKLQYAELRLIVCEEVLCRDQDKVQKKKH